MQLKTLTPTLPTSKDYWTAPKALLNLQTLWTAPSIEWKPLIGNLDQFGAFCRLISHRFPWFGQQHTCNILQLQVLHKRRTASTVPSFVHSSSKPVWPRYTHHELCRPQVAHIQILEPRSNLAPGKRLLAAQSLQMAINYWRNCTLLRRSPLKERQSSGLHMEMLLVNLLRVSVIRGRM